MVAVPVPPAPDPAPKKPKGPPAEPPKLEDLPVQGGYVVTPVTEVPALTKLVTSVAILGFMSIQSWGWKNAWHTIFTRPTHWFGRLFSHFMPNPDRLRKQLEHDMNSVASRLFAQQAPQIGRWMHGQAKIVEQLTGTLMTTAEWTHDALVILRHTTVPTLIYRAVHPLALAINRLDARLTTVEDKLSGATGYINSMLKGLPWGTGATFDIAIRQWTGAFAQLFNSWYDTWLPRIQRIYNVRLPQLERTVDDIFRDLYQTGRNSLGGIRLRLGRIEDAIGGILADPTTWILAALGLAMVPALTAGGMRTALRNLTCPNTQAFAEEACAQPAGTGTQWARLLEGLAAFALGALILVDPKEVIDAGETVEGILAPGFEWMAELSSQSFGEAEAELAGAVTAFLGL